MTERALVKRWFREALSLQLHLPDLEVFTPSLDGVRGAGRSVADAPIFIVTPEVTDVLQAAVKSWDTNEKLMPDDISDFPSGFAYFPKMMLGEGTSQAHKDEFGEEAGIRASAWNHVSEPGMDMQTFHVFALGGERCLILDRASFGDDSDEEDRGGSLLRVLWRFLQQKIAVTSVARPGNIESGVRAVRPIETLRIVTLRRPTYRASGTGDSQREYSHQWIVRGHWRNQWYPRVQDHRQKWIDAHVAGPEDKPLVVKDSVYLVGR